MQVDLLLSSYRPNQSVHTYCGKPIACLCALRSLFDGGDCWAFWVPWVYLRGWNFISLSTRDCQLCPYGGQPSTWWAATENPNSPCPPARASVRICIQSYISSPRCKCPWQIHCVIGISDTYSFCTVAHFEWLRPRFRGLAELYAILFWCIFYDVRKYTVIELCFWGAHSLRSLVLVWSRSHITRQNELRARARGIAQCCCETLLCKYAHIVIRE